jgi:hypothetical protein
MVGAAVSRTVARLVLATAVAAVATAGASGLASTADASIGTGVGANPLVLSQPAQPGRSYALPALYVVNTGTQHSDYAVRVLRLQRGTQHDVPSAWIHVARAVVGLDAGSSTSVPLTLTVPASAASGEYMSDVVAGTVTAGHIGAELGAQAATQLLFTVDAASGLAWPVPLWGNLAALAAIALGALVLLARRSGLRLHVERR